MLFFRHGARNHGIKVVIHSGISIFAAAAYETFRAFDHWCAIAHTSDEYSGSRRSRRSPKRYTVPCRAATASPEGADGDAVQSSGRMA